MNKITSSCEKLNNYFQIGQAGSLADCKDKLQNHCFGCYSFITCQNSQEFLQGIIKQQNNFMALERIGKSNRQIGE